MTSTPAPATAWSTRFAELQAVAASTSLTAQQLEDLAVAAHMLGEDEVGRDAWTRAHETHRRAGRDHEAARCAFWLGWGLLIDGRSAPARGWIRRARRHAELARAVSGRAGQVDGLLGVVDAVHAMDEGDFRSAHDRFLAIRELGEELGDQDLVALGDLGLGETLLRIGDPERAGDLLDDAMVAVAADELSPLVAGTVYCALLVACDDLFDVARASAWTASLTTWASDAAMVPFRGQCLVHRSALAEWAGDWDGAMHEAVRAREVLSKPPPRAAVGEAWYREGELHRLRGDHAEAERCYAAATRHGHDGQPGVALVRAAAGNADEALRQLRAVVAEAVDPARRARLLPALVDLALKVGDLPVARRSADSLVASADGHPSRQLRGYAAHARGAVLLAEGDPRRAHTHLRDACRTWQELEAPYLVARAREALARVHDELGDRATAASERQAALETYRRLGAIPDERRISGVRPPRPSGLTPRQVEVLCLVAAGMSNAEVAAELVISERTVERHLSNVFARIGVGNRAAATAFAYEEGLVG